MWDLYAFWKRRALHAKESCAAAPSRTASFWTSCCMPRCGKTFNSENCHYERSEESAVVCAWNDGQGNSRSLETRNSKLETRNFFSLPSRCFHRRGWIGALPRLV